MSTLEAHWPVLIRYSNYVTQALEAHGLVLINPRYSNYGSSLACSNKYSGRNINLDEKLSATGCK